MADWFYIGHYGQLGPLTLEQIEELVEARVIESDTYVWRTGMADWKPAKSVSEFQTLFARIAVSMPPPPPPARPQAATGPSEAPTAYSVPPIVNPATPTLSRDLASVHHAAQPHLTGYVSDRSRLLAGILQIVFPGVGRMYLGYTAYGVIQLVLAICSGGILWLWSLIEGILILTGHIKVDGYGRRLLD